MYLACSPITWTVIRRQPDNPYAGRAGFGRLLDEIREAGYTHVVAGRTSAGQEEAFERPEGLLRFLADHGLQPAPSSIGGQGLLDPAERAAAVEGARQAAAYTRGLGLDALFIMPPSAPHRWAAAGHFSQGNRPDGLADEQWAVHCETLNRIGEACRAEGVWLCLHNHAGMFWETGDEFERAIAGTDPNLVALGPDVGHMVWGGIDPLPWFRRHMDRVKSIHIKDMHAAVLRQAREEKLSYQETSARGVFAEIGEGCVDWPALFGFWRDAGYDGAVVVESDRTQKPTPAESITASR
ncbi:MAG: TIM barrel protein, partial [Chloroflexi bacterium]|nr:TIM barrel protein [Chloroflexota bacterium]